MKSGRNIGVKKIALCDIRNYLKAQNTPKHARINIKGCAAEVWNVSANALDTPETRALNRQLGIHKINKGYKENQAIDLPESTINPPRQFDFLIDLTDIFKNKAGDYYTECPDKKKIPIEVETPEAEVKSKPEPDRLFKRGDKVNYTPLQFSAAGSFNTYLKSFYGYKDFYPVQGPYVWLTIPKYNDICIIEHPNGFPAKCLIESFSLSNAPLKIYLKYIFASQGELINN